MRILVTTFPAYGHLHPMVPLAVAAIERGADVRVATGRKFGNWVKACGLSATPAGLDAEDLETQASARFPGPLRNAHMFTTIAVPRMFDDLIELSTTWRPDLIIHEESEYAGPLAATLLGVPCITHSWAAPAYPRAERETDRDLLAPIWAQRHAGQPVLCGDAYLDACPPPFQTEAILAIAGVRPIRPVLFDGPQTSPPEWLARIERPAAYVSFGTVRQFSRAEWLQQAMDAASQVVASVIVTCGPNSPELLVPSSASVFVEQYLPQSSVLEHVDVVVSHGGAGTTLGALCHGLPHVVIPHGATSQQINAERVDALGIGIHVTDDQLRSLPAAIHAAATEPAYAIAAARVRDALNELPSPEVVLTELLNDFT